MEGISISQVHIKITFLCSSNLSCFQYFRHTAGIKACLPNSNSVYLLVLLPIQSGHTYRLYFI